MQRARENHISPNALAKALRELQTVGFVDLSLHRIEGKPTVFYVLQRPEDWETFDRFFEYVTTRAHEIGIQIKSAKKKGGREKILAEGLFSLYLELGRLYCTALKIAFDCEDSEILLKRVERIVPHFLPHYLVTMAMLCFGHKTVAPRALEIFDQKISSYKALSRGGGEKA